MADDDKAARDKGFASAAQQKATHDALDKQADVNAGSLKMVGDLLKSKAPPEKK